MGNEVIKHKREMLGLSQSALGKIMGISQQHIDRYEKGYPVPLDKILLFSEKLGINKFELLPEDFRPEKTQQIYRIGFVEAGAWTEAVQLPHDEWMPVNYPVNDSLRKRNVFALGVRGNSMNKIFPPDRTTLICLDIQDYCDMVKEGIQNGDFVVAQRVSNDGKYEATVKRYTRLDDGTVVLEAMSNDPRYTNIIVGSENCEYQITAVVIDYQTKLKDL